VKYRKLITRPLKVKSYCSIIKEHMKAIEADATEEGCPFYEFWGGSTLYPIWLCINCMHWEVDSGTEKRI